MGLFSELFSRGAALTLEEFTQQMADLQRTGREKEAVKLAHDFRLAADRDRRINEAERRYQNGVGWALSIKPLLTIAGGETGQARHQALVASYCAFRASLILLQRFRDDKSSPYSRTSTDLLGEAFDLTTNLDEKFGYDVVCAADEEAGDAIRKVFRNLR